MPTCHQPCHLLPLQQPPAIEHSKKETENTEIAAFAAITLYLCSAVARAQISQVAASSKQQNRQTASGINNLVAATTNYWSKEAHISCHHAISRAP